MDLGGSTNYGLDLAALDVRLGLPSYMGLRRTLSLGLELRRHSMKQFVNLEYFAFLLLTCPIIIISTLLRIF